MEENQEYRKAIHESAHAVMHLLGGFNKIKHMTLLADDESKASIEYYQMTAGDINNLNKNKSPDEINTALIDRFLAGSIAEAILDNQVSFSLSMGKGNTDLNNIMQVVTDNYPNTCDTWVFIAKREPCVRKDLERCWGIIELLASSLVEEKRMEWKDIQQILLTSIIKLPEEDKEWIKKKVLPDLLKST